VSEEMGALLRRWKAQRAEEQFAFGPTYVDEGWVCAEPDGSPVQPDTLSRRFRALERKASVPHRGLHAYRHTPAEMALAGGCGWTSSRGSSGTQRGDHGGRVRASGRRRPRRRGAEARGRTRIVRGKYWGNEQARRAHRHSGLLASSLVDGVGGGI
jgi:hypothetical protein